MGTAQAQGKGWGWEAWRSMVISSGPGSHSQATLRTACTYGFAPRGTSTVTRSNICGARLTGQSSPRDSCTKEGGC